MVYRIYVEKKAGLANEAESLKNDIRAFLGVQGLKELRILNRYDADGIDKALFDACRFTVFAEAQLDQTSDQLDAGGADVVFAVEYLPGQFDQRADSAAQCIQIISRGEKPLVRTAKVYLLSGDLTAEDVDAIKKYVINPVESREAALEEFSTLETTYEIPQTVELVEGFRTMDQAALQKFLNDRGLAMDMGDLGFCQEYFRKEGRDPSITEIKMIDTYWSDHCRHTTFNTIIDEVAFEDTGLQEAYDGYLAARKEIGRTKPVTLMDLGTLSAKYLKAKGLMPNLDESAEINACTVKIDVEIEGKKEKWLLLFKNETHNHPTEIEPFGGAATCIGGAIRDPLSGRAYVYAAMRLTGAGNPLKPVSETLEGKLPQRKIVTTAAAGYRSYGNQIGLATGQVDELYHDGYTAKRMEVGAVVGAVPADNVRREEPQPGDAVILLGGRTGRDGCGGATGSSKSHTLESLEACGAEVQKGNAPEERKLQRLFRNPEAVRMIKRCNDFGAGGVSVAIGELADGLDIDLNTVPKKYDGLDGTELAISESQERMAVVVEAGDVARFMALAAAENLESTVVAKVKGDPRLTMTWNGKTIVDISREFLDSNGAEKHIVVKPEAPKPFAKKVSGNFAEEYKALAEDLNVCSKKGLSEGFDSTIGVGTVLMPFGGKYQMTPIQAMVNKVAVEKANTDTCSLMAWGCNPYILEKSPFHGAYLAVVESISKLVAAGAAFSEVYLSFQEYFEKLGRDCRSWGKPFAALLGAFKAQQELGAAAIGGKDSMSGTFEKINVPPTLISFAVTTEQADNIVSPEFKAAGHRVLLLKPETDKDGLPAAASLKKNYDIVTELCRKGAACAVFTPGFGGVAEAVLKMALGNRIGFAYDGGVSMEDMFGYCYGGFVIEMTDDSEAAGAVLLGVTTAETAVSYGGTTLSLDLLQKTYEDKLESVYPCNIPQPAQAVPVFNYDAGSCGKAAGSIAVPKVLIPVFPGTNCEYDTAKAFAAAGADPQILVITNRSAADINDSVERMVKALRESQIVFLPGGFSGGDEPDGSGKFINAFFRNEAVKAEVNELLKNRDGLMGGICNGFQALIKLGLVPYGEIVDMDEKSPTLTFNPIGRHQSRLVRIRVASNKSPWFAATKPGQIYTVPVSHGEGRFLAEESLVWELAETGQIATQYVDLNGTPSMDIRVNPNGSVCAVEGILSPDGRVFGKMGHAERTGRNLYKNVEGNYDMGLFRSAVEYFK